MPSQLTATLTSKERVSVLLYLEENERQEHDRAVGLMRAGAVVQTYWCDPHEHIHAQVRGEHLYEQEIAFENDELVSTQCTCPAGFDCKHVVAVLLVALAGSPAVSRPALSAGDGELVAAVRARVKKPLEPKALNTLAVIERWWHGEVQSVSEGDFRRMAGGPDLWARNNKSLFPKSHPPKSAWEFLHYIDHVAEKLRISLPNPIPSVLDRALQKELVDVWERERALREWRGKLEKWAVNAQHTPKAASVPEFRLRLVRTGAVVEWRPPRADAFAPIKITNLRQWCGVIQGYSTGGDLAAMLRPQDGVVLQAAGGNYGKTELPAADPTFVKCLTRLLLSSDMRSAVVAESGEPLQRHDTPLRWELREAPATGGDHELRLLDAEGKTPPPALVIVKSKPMLYIAPAGVWEINAWPFESAAMSWPQRVPASALESSHGATVLEHLGIPLPRRLAARVVVVKPRITVTCQIKSRHPSDYVRVRTSAVFGPAAPEENWNGSGWQAVALPPPPSAGDQIVRIDRSVLQQANDWLTQLGLKLSPYESEWEKRTSKDFPDEFLAWIARRPEGVEIELDRDLASLRDGKISATVKLDVEESGIDWFDLKVALDVSDTTLSREEIDLLLKAKGKWVRIAGKGWRRLEYQLSEEQERELAEMGLAVADFDGQSQRLHALQLAGNASKKNSLLPAARVEEVRLRASEIQTRVVPELPAAITATLRPYQLEGFHFLAYLTANNFGGVLADDMGLGKTLQTLAWLAWLRGDAPAPGQKKGAKKSPALVICPKSVQDNWRAEVARFFPALRVEVWNRKRAGQPLPDDCDLLVIHYQQLRNNEDQLTRQHWSAVILDEAQAIKNPSSQTAITACKLRADHRLALTGTPIENRLLDLWSIMAFAMPGVLSNRAQFSKHFDGKGDPFARRRLAARVRPFLLRRTKKEVASDLPDRIEEDLVCELEGTQEKLYQAELKRARAALLKLKTSKELDKARFNILTSLLRLRQICCHPKLVGCEDNKAGSAKLDALIELLEPIMEEGHKVIVFSQFVDMIHLIQDELEKNQWPHFILTGATDERGPLVESFQKKEGAAVFLISLKAGGFGLNLTAASYVVLYDPWWNPAVEAQAIDRTHRIGQTRTVIAYRLIMQETIEEKIRLLQMQKGALANDILGEENFAKALTLDDFRFLLGEET